MNQSQMWLNGLPRLVRLLAVKQFLMQRSEAQVGRFTFVYKIMLKVPADFVECNGDEFKEPTLCYSKHLVHWCKPSSFYQPMNEEEEGKWQFYTFTKHFPPCSKIFKIFMALVPSCDMVVTCMTLTIGDTNQLAMPSLRMSLWCANTLSGHCVFSWVWNTASAARVFHCAKQDISNLNDPLNRKSFQLASIEKETAEH